MQIVDHDLSGLLLGIGFCEWSINDYPLVVLVPKYYIAHGQATRECLAVEHVVQGGNQVSNEVDEGITS